MEAEVSATTLKDQIGEQAATTDTLGRIPIGKIGVWWFLASEIMVFGGLIICYTLVRIQHGGWASEAAHVNWRLGALNTLVLVTSSLTMILAYGAVQSDERARVRIYLAMTVALGLAFLGIKSVEYTYDIREGLTPLTGLFWSFYYLMTGLHALHVTAGIVLNSFLLILATRGSLWPHRQQRIEFAGLYWHFVDVVWIFLFPLLYLT